MMTTYPGNKIRRLFFKIPLILWRLGLGPIIGHYLVVLTTWGRKSGLARHTMLEYFTWRGKIYVICAWPQSDWYKNLTADSHATIQTWQGAERMIANRVMDDEELMKILDMVQERQSKLMAWYFEDEGVPPTREGILSYKERFHVVRFDPTMECTPLPLRVDLAWLWPVMMLAMMLFGKRRQSEE
ncbi:MAG: nitroreductase family deazaflavin-dependent oxidoreductase [Anaerolineales bacterium]